MMRIVDRTRRVPIAHGQCNGEGRGASEWANETAAAGAAADARGRWAVKEITAWRGGSVNREAWVVSLAGV